MIRCLPKGVCSWNYALEGDGVFASVELNVWKEEGAIILDDNRLGIQKDGLFNGRWTLWQDELVVAFATKTSAFQRTFEIKKSLDHLTLRPESALGRSFLIERSNQVTGRIFPDHAFTRRASIDMKTMHFDAQLIAFSFWLVVLTWRRTASGS